MRTRALVTRVVFEGRRAVGVEYLKGGRVATARARREVILSGGAINSPQVLMLSGIGNADALKALGIAVIQHLPGVGENLQDHIEAYVQYACKQPITLYSATNPLAKLKIGVEWILTGKGLGGTNHFEFGRLHPQRGGRSPSRPAVPLPADGGELRRVVSGRGPRLSGAYRPDAPDQPRLRQAQVGGSARAPARAVQLHANRAGSPRDARRHQADARDHAQKAFDPFRGEELAPGPAVKSDADIDGFVRAKAESAYHPSCTCRMGTDDMAVVDGSGRVHGVEGLRVVDASIMPDVVSGNLNVPTIMMAEKLADAIRGRPELPQEKVPVWVNPNYEKQQR